MTRQEHLNWCKKRALEYLDSRDVAQAVTSMLSDLQKHEGTALREGSPLAMLGLMAAMKPYDVEGARRFIVGFN